MNLRTRAQMYVDSGLPIPIDLAVALGQAGYLLDEYLDKLDGYQVIDVDALIEEHDIYNED